MYCLNSLLLAAELVTAFPISKIVCHNFKHTSVRDAGGFTNEAAEEHIIQMLRWAKDFDMRRLSTQDPAPGTSATAEMGLQSSHSNKDDEIVFVLHEDLRSVKYVLSNPSVKQNACSCNIATQGRCSHHQVAWLLSQYPYGLSAEKLIVSKLGTKMGYQGGCALDNIECLIDALDSLHMKISEQHSVQPNPAPVPVVAHAGDQGAVPQVAKAPCEGVELGPIAVRNHMQWVTKAFEQMLLTLDAADPCQLKRIMVLQCYDLDRCLCSYQEMVQTEQKPQKKGNCNTKRIKGII